MGTAILELPPWNSTAKKTLADLTAIAWVHYTACTWMKEAHFWPIKPTCGGFFELVPGRYHLGHLSRFLSQRS